MSIKEKIKELKIKVARLTEQLGPVQHIISDEVFQKRMSAIFKMEDRIDSLFELGEV